LKTCKHCGAVLSRADETRFEDIIGQEHVKRALEVAIAGEHTIAFIGNGEAEALAQIATKHGLTAWAVQTCPCGHFGFDRASDNPGECTCSLSQVARWQKRKAYQNALGAEIVIECPPPRDYQIDAWASGRKGEPESSVLARVKGRGERPGATLDQTCRSLLKAAVTQLDMGSQRVQAIIGVAQTIAALAHEDKIGCAHLAEAIQYRPRRNGY